MKTPTRDLCGRQTPPLALGSFAAETRRQTNGRASYRGAARFNLRLRTGARPVLICASARGAARFYLRLRTGARPVLFFAAHACLLRRFFISLSGTRQVSSNFFTPVGCGGLLFHYPARGKFFKLFYACLLRRTIKVQAPLTSYSPTAEMQKQSPAAKGSSPRFHLKCPPPVRTRSTSSPSVNSL